MPSKIQIFKHSPGSFQRKQLSFAKIQATKSALLLSLLWPLACLALLLVVLSTSGRNLIDVSAAKLNPTMARPAAPGLKLVKSIKDLNGNDLNGQFVAPGQILNVSLKLSNPSNQAVVRSFIAEFIDPQLTYMSNSVKIIPPNADSGSQPVPQTDKRDEDQVDFFLPCAESAPPCSTVGKGQLNIATGAGAGGHNSDCSTNPNCQLVGGTLNPEKSTEITFQVKVSGSAVKGTVISTATGWSGDDAPFPVAVSDPVQFTVSGGSPTLTISVKDESNTKDLNHQPVIPGQTLTFNLTLNNLSNQPLTKSFIAQFIPAEFLTYVADSVEVTAGANPGKKSDKPDDDQVDAFLPCTASPQQPCKGVINQVNIATGAGAGGHTAEGLLKGGTLATGTGPDASSTVSFRAKVNANLTPGAKILMGAQFGANDIYPCGNSNLVDVVFSPVVPRIGPLGNPEAIASGDLTIKKLNFPTANGITTTAGTVEFSNTLTNAGAQAGNIVIRAATIPQGFTVQASIDSGATFVSLNSGSPLTTDTPVNPGERRNVDLRVLAPAGLAINTNFDLVIQAVSAIDATQSDNTTDRVVIDSSPPNLALLKEVRDLNGNDLNGKTVLPGQEIEYRLTLSNPSPAGAQPVSNAFIAEFLPPNVLYVANSVKVGNNSKTDGPGDDEVVYYPAPAGAPAGAGFGQINVFTGAGATSRAGGTLAPGQSATATFHVKINPGAQTGTVINNGADWGGNDFYAGGKSNVVTVTVGAVNCPLVGPFGNPAAVGPTDNNDDFTLRKINSALSQPINEVGFVNTLTNTGSTPGNFVISALGIPRGFTVKASINSGMTFKDLTAGDKLITPTAVNPGEQRNIDVRIIPPPGLAASTDYAVVIRVASDTDAACFNQTVDKIRLEPNPPNLSLVKSATDVNGGSLLPGDVIEYSLTLSNPSQTATVTNTFIAEFIPPNVTYVPNSVRVTSGANAGAKSDAVRDDQVDYIPPTTGNNGQINIFTGTGAGINRGGTLAPGESNTAVFRVTVNSNLACNSAINNGADYGGDDFYAAGKSNVSTVVVACLPDLTISKTHSPNEFTSGATGNFTLTVRNVGEASTLGEVKVTDTLPTGLQPTAPPSAGGWACSLAAQTITCTRSDALAAGASYPPITVPVAVSGSATGTVTNTAVVSGGGETNTANNSATDSVNISAPPACVLIGPFQHPAAGGQADSTDDITQRNVSFQPVNGVTTVAGSVGFINTLLNSGGTPGQIAISAPGIPPGFSVKASIDSGATFRILDGGATLMTPSAVNPGEQRNLDVRISVPAGLTVGASFDVVIQAGAGICSDRTVDRITLVVPPNPELKLVKDVVDVNGGEAMPGDELIYSLTLSNPSNKPVANTFIADFIPANVTYVPNSVRVTSGEGAGPDPKTDKFGDDVADYFPPQAGNNGQLNIFTGKGAAANAAASTDRERRGGTLDPGDSTTVTFRVVVNQDVACGTKLNNGAEWGGDLIYPGGSSNVATLITCQATSCQTVCFRSAAYFLLHPEAIPNGTVLIGGVNSNNQVPTSHPSVRQALLGQFGVFIREHVTAQLNLNGVEQANVVTAFASTLSCYGLVFREITVNNAALTPGSKVSDLVRLAEAVAKRDASGVTRDGCILTKVFNQLNGNSPSASCNLTAGSIDFSSCP